MKLISVGEPFVMVLGNVSEGYPLRSRYPPRSSPFAVNRPLRMLFITALVRSTREGNIYTWECLSVHIAGGGYPIPGNVCSHCGGGGYPIPGLAGGGVPHPRSGRGVPHPDLGYSPWTWDGVPPPVLGQGTPPDLGWGTSPSPGTGYPPHTWDRVPLPPPPPDLGQGPPPDLGWGTAPPPPA